MRVEPPVVLVTAIVVVVRLRGLRNVARMTMSITARIAVGLVIINTEVPSSLIVQAMAADLWCCMGVDWNCRPTRQSLVWADGVEASQ